MAIGTEELTLHVNNKLCAELNITKYDIKPYTEHGVGGDGLYPWLVRVEKDHRKYSFVIPVISKRQVAGIFPFTFVYYDYDIQAMEEEVKRMILSSPISRLV